MLLTHAQQAAPVPVVLVIMRPATPATAATRDRMGYLQAGNPRRYAGVPRYARLWTGAIKCTACR
jgi:hypothetical protein